MSDHSVSGDLNDPARYATLMLLVEKQRQESEKRAIEEYRQHDYPKELLRDRIYGIVACAANATVDWQRPEPVSEPFDWCMNMGRTNRRLETEPLFHRMVKMMVHGVIEEVDRYLTARGRDEAMIERERCAAIAQAYSQRVCCECGEVIAEEIRSGN
jgi:hypothetical protein